MSVPGVSVARGIGRAAVSVAKIPFQAVDLADGAIFELHDERVLAKGSIRHKIGRERAEFVSADVDDRCAVVVAVVNARLAGQIGIRQGDQFVLHGAAFNGRRGAFQRIRMRRGAGELRLLSHQVETGVCQPAIQITRVKQGIRHHGLTIVAGVVVKIFSVLIKQTIGNVWRRILTVNRGGILHKCVVH